jgi:hypothetical protein
MLFVGRRQPHKGFAGFPGSQHSPVALKYIWGVLQKEQFIDPVARYLKIKLVLKPR